MLLHDEKFIDLKTLGQILLLNDTRATQNWCAKKNIDIEYIGSRKVVYQFLVNIELDKNLVKKLKDKYPNKWEELYRLYQDNDRIGYLQLIDDNPEFDKSTMNKRVSAKSRFAKSLIK